MYKNNRKHQAGDTLIEVILSTVILSIVLAGSYTLSNRANRIGQSAIERTEASNLIQTNAELLRGYNDLGGSEWSNIIAKANSADPDYSSGDRCNNINGQPFYLNPALANPVVDYTDGNDLNPNDLFNVWIQAYDLDVSVDPTDNIIDFHIRACWEGIGEEPQQRSVSVIRLQK